MIYLAVHFTCDFNGGDIYVSPLTTDLGAFNGLCLVFSTMSLVDQFVVSRVFNSISKSWPVVVLYLYSPFPAQLLWQNRDLQTSRHLLKRNCFPSELLNHIPLKSHSFEFITFLCLLISNWRFHKMHWRKSQSEKISLILSYRDQNEEKIVAQPRKIVASLEQRWKLFYGQNCCTQSLSKEPCAFFMVSVTAALQKRLFVK